MRTRPVRSAIKVALFAIASTLPISALAVYEAEPNDSYNAPQRLVIGSDGTATVTGSIGDPSGAPLVNDVDFYAFEGKAGDVVTIDIDGGIKGAAGGSDVDTYLTLFGPDSMVIRETDNGPLQGDGSFLDAQLTNIRLQVDGIYTVAVTASVMMFMDGGVLIDGLTANSNGSYALNISGVTGATAPPPPPPSAQQINIDIKPRDRGRAHIQPNARGKIAVALLSSEEFDALEVDHGSVTFGKTGKEASALRCGSYAKRGRHDWDEWDDDDDNRRGRHYKDRRDVDGDGRPDLVCRFENRETGFELGDMEGILMGRTSSGKSIEGRGPLKVYPAKRHYGHDHRRR